MYHDFVRMYESSCMNRHAAGMQRHPTVTNEYMHMVAWVDGILKSGFSIILLI